jgi:hypothetical protein
MVYKQMVRTERKNTPSPGAMNPLSPTKNGPEEEVR